MILKIRPELLASSESIRDGASKSPESIDDVSQDVSPHELQTALPTMAAERELLRLAMRHKGEVVTAVLKDSALCELLSSATLEFLSSFAMFLRALPAEQEARKRQVRELLGRFGPSWESLWREAHKDVGGNVVSGSFAAEPGATLAGEALDDALAHLRRLAKKQRIQIVMAEIEAQMQAASGDQEKLDLARAKVELARQLTTL